MNRFLTFQGDEDHSRWLEASELRQQVFVSEQGVPFVLEVDARDFLASTTHLLGVDPQGGLWGVARILQVAPGEYYVGRVVVAKPLRGSGLGRALIEEASRYVLTRTGVGETAEIRLDSQVQAIDFYLSCGYRLTEDLEFLDAGIRHRSMVRKLYGGDFL